MTGTQAPRSLGMLGGILFAACFFAWGILGGVLAPLPLPLPDAPAADVARYYSASGSAVAAVAVCQMVAAAALFVFAGCVAAFVRRIRGAGDALARVNRAAGVASAALLLLCALVSLLLLSVAGGGNLGRIDALRRANFLTGGALHVATLGICIGTAALAARRARALPGWIVWLGIVQGAVALLSLLSIVVFPAALFILLGRLLGFVWCIAAGIVLAFGAGRTAAAGGDRHVLA